MNQKYKGIDIQSLNSWIEMEEISPIDLTRVKSYARDFESQISLGINLKNLEFVKNRLFEARNSLDLLITTLIQVLYDPQALTQPEDRVLFAWLKDDLGRFLQTLDETENSLVVAMDSPNRNLSRVGISRLSAYSKELKNAYQSLYEALIKSLKEYHTFPETETIKRDKRSFIYILFHVMQITMSLLGSITRKPNTPLGKRGTVSAYPQTWNGLMSKEGQKEISAGYKQDTGSDLPNIPSSFLEEKEGGMSGDMDEEDA